MAFNDTLTNTSSKLFRFSGQFSSTINTSQTVVLPGQDITGISWDGTNTPISTTRIFLNPVDSKLLLISGQFSSTIKTSQSILSLADAAWELSWDTVNTPWIGDPLGSAFGGTILFLQSGQFSSTVKTSLNVSSNDNFGFGISWDTANTPWAGLAEEKLYLAAGQFTSTLLDSEDVSVIGRPHGITYDGTNTPWIGRDDTKAYLTSGQFTSTIKTSQANLGNNGIETQQLIRTISTGGTLITNADETDIVAGGLVLTLTINTGRLSPTSDRWVTTVGDDNAITQALIDGISSLGSEANGWNAVVRAGLTHSDVVRTSDSVVTITLPAFAGYDIVVDEVIVVTVPAVALDGGVAVVAEPLFLVAAQLAAAAADTIWCGATDEKLYLTSGQFSSTLKDSEFVGGVDTPSGVGAGSPTEDVSWISSGSDKAYLQSGQFTSTIKTSLDISVVDSITQGISWDETNSPVMGDGNNKLFLTSGRFTTTIKDSESVAAVNAIGEGISWDGANTPWCGSLSLVTGGSRLYLESGQFASTLKTSLDVNPVDSDANGISYSLSSGDTPWIGNAANKLYLTSGQFTSTIKTSEDVSAIESTPTDIDVNDRLVSSSALTITLVAEAMTDIDVRAGGKSIAVAISGDTWAATLGEDNAITQAFIDGFLATSSPPAGWNNVIRTGLTAANVSRFTDGLVAITLPPFSSYAIGADEEVEVVIPASAMTSTAVDTPTDPTSFTIVAVLIPSATRPRIRTKYRDSEFLSYFGPDGTEYAMNTPHTPGRYVLSQSGWGTPPINYITQRSPFQHGQTVRDFFLEPRIIQILERQNFNSRDAWWDGRAALLDAIRPNRQLALGANQPGRLERCLVDGSRRAIDVYITEGPRFEPRTGTQWDEWSFQEVLRFIAFNPVVYDPTRVDVLFPLTGLDTELVFPIDFPIQFGGGQITDSLNISYVGTWESYPVIIITGPITNPRIENLTTGEKLELTTRVGGGDTVTIDTSFQNKSVVDQDGNNLIGTLSTDSDLQTFRIAPDPEAPGGVNQMRLTGTDATGSTSVEIRFFTRYFGI